MAHNIGDMNLEINNNEIEKSFDRIAKDLLTNANQGLKVKN
jgi:hypothetical protein